MSIQNLTVQNLRVLQQVEIELSPKLNLIYGLNASGKTSLLEAIFFLSAARSFRTRQIGEVLSHQADSMLISARIRGSDERIVPIGIKRSRRDSLMKANGEVVQRVSELAKWLPVQIIHPESHQLVIGGPRHRRQYLDWGVFHVEHQFYPVWARYQRALKQRNAALRQRMKGMEGAWDAELSQAAARLHTMREEYLRKLLKLLPHYTEAIMGEQDVELTYLSGWDAEETLASQLQLARARDWQRGYTTLGPHRADLQLKVNGYRAQGEISRGQQKMLVAALRLAQADLFSRETGRPCVIMVDDLPAELDVEHRSSLMELLRQMEAQVFATCVDAGQVDTRAWDEKKMFHVEHGLVKAVL